MIKKANVTRNRGLCLLFMYILIKSIFFHINSKKLRIQDFLRIFHSKNAIFDYIKIEILGDLERYKLLLDNVLDDEITKKLNVIRCKGKVIIHLYKYLILI